MFCYGTTDSCYKARLSALEFVGESRAKMVRKYYQCRDGHDEETGPDGE
jgi:hypothetical protein